MRNVMEESGKEADVTAGVIGATKETVQEDAEKIAGFATIGKGEGIEHALIRQLENDPSKFGFTGDANDAVALHRWAGGEAHKKALKEHFADVGIEAEMRVKFDSKNPIQFILNP